MATRPGGRRTSLDRGCLTLLEALLAVDGPSLGGLEGDGRLLAALGASGGGLDALALGMVQARVALRLTVLAALGLVLEVLVGVEELLTRGPSERLMTLDANQRLVSVLHVLSHFARAEDPRSPFGLGSAPRPQSPAASRGRI